MKAIPLFSLLLLGAAPGASDSGFVSVTQTEYQTGDRGVFTIGVLDLSHSDIRYWARFEHPQSTHKLVLWADSRNCSVLKDVVADLQNLPLPKLDIPVANRSQTLPTTDGVVFEMRIDGAYSMQSAGLKITSNLGTPLADWALASQKKLQSCWSKEAPQI